MSKEEEIYNYLCKNHVGKDNLINNYELRVKFKILSDKSLRKIIENIRGNDKYKEFIASKAGNKGGYWIATNKSECEETIEHLEKRAMKILETSERLENKSKLKFLV